MGKHKDIDININDIEDLEEEISAQIGQVNESKELFSNSNVRTRTDLSDNEIILATKIRYMRVQFDIPVYDVLLQEFMEMRLSRSRKSRKEYIESMKQKAQNMIGGFTNGFGLQK